MDYMEIGPIKLHCPAGTFSKNSPIVPFRTTLSGIKPRGLSQSYCAMSKLNNFWLIWSVVPGPKEARQMLDYAAIFVQISMIPVMFRR
jgi:hypothetical protein